MGIKWFQLVDEAGAAKAEVDYVSVDTAIVPVLRKAVKAEYADTLLADTPSVKLVVYANRADFGAKCAPLGYGDSIASLGESLNDPLIVQTPPASSDVCLECAVYGEGIVFPVAIAREAKVSALQKAIVKEKEQVNSRFKVDPSAIMLFLAKDANGAWLKHDDSLETLLRHDVNSQCKKMLSSLKLTHYFDEEFSVNGGEVHILVKLPESPSASYTSAVLMPPMAPLENAEELCNECAAVPTWQPGVVHSIQHLHAFMKPLGGCTQRGEVYWREEEKQIATLLGEWFPASGGDTFADKRIVLKGSPGVGKSTMFCLIAMYVAIVKKKNVLVVRKVAGVFYVFFVGHDSDQVVCFLKQDCAVEDAVAILRKLKENHRDFPSVCLMLDGFVYEVIPAGLKAFHLLATSQQVDLNSEDRAVTDSYLFPSWRPDDLFSLGESIYGWSEDVMNKRFYYSGGSVRDFTLKNADKIEIGMLTVVNHVGDPLPLLCCSGVINSGKDQIDSLRRTFVQREQVGNPLAYLNPTYWDQAVDSAFAITALQKRKRVGDKDIVSVYHWARANGSKSAALAGLLFELIIHHLAADNTLQLSTTPYHKLEFRQPDAPKSLQFTQLSMKKGGSIETDSTDDKLEKSLVDWKNDDTYSYWRPSRQNFNTIDSIVKLTEGGVAYLQMTVSNKHPVNVAFLKTLNGILGEEKPKFIVVCPTLEAAEGFVLGTRTDVDDALAFCDVRVAFYGEEGIDPKMDGPRNNVPLPATPTRRRSTRTAAGNDMLTQDKCTSESKRLKHD